MKQILLGLLLLTSSVLFAQDRDRDNRQDRDYRDNRNGNYQRNIPPEVQHSFQRDYPNANNAQWNRSDRHWHATYQDREHGNRNAEAYYDPRGRHVDTHIVWDRSQLPSDYDRRIYRRYHTRDYQVYRIERPNAVPVFQLLLNLGGGRRTIYTDQYGNEIRYRDVH